MRALRTGLHQPAQPGKTGGVQRAHGLHQHHAVFLGGPKHLPRLLRRGCHGLFAQHMLARAQHAQRLRTVQAVWAGDIHGVHIFICGQRLQAVVIRLGAILRAERLRALLCAGIHRLQHGALPGRRQRLQKAGGDGACANYSKPNHAFSLPFFAAGLTARARAYRQ